MKTFFFTDIEGSTTLWQQHPREMATALAIHDEMLTEMISEYGGKVVKHTGDGLFAAFDSGKPLDCALAIQSKVQDQNWGGLDELRIRIAINVGEAEARGNDYFGPEINLTARVLAVAWGGQILLSSSAVNNLELPPLATLDDLGTHVLESIPQPQTIFQLSRPDLRILSFPHLRTQSGRPNNLPQETTPFIGRARELAEVAVYLQSPSCRLLTIIGSGGMGKTRLAQKAARELLDFFPQGVFFVALAPLSMADQVIPAVAEAIGFNFYSQRDPLTQLCNYLSEKKILLIFDNFEHLLEATIILGELLQSSANLKIMTTSRARLDIHSETLFTLEGMKQAFDAIDLFVQNARRADSSFVPSKDEETHIVDICLSLEGNPLAIELAASWVRHLGCAEIEEEIKKDIAFISSNASDLPQRHRSMEAVFQYSWELLSVEEKKAFRNLALFRGGFNRQATDQVAQVTLKTLVSLLDKSLLKRDENGRFHTHELLNVFAWEKLQSDQRELKEIRQRYCQYYLGMLVIPHEFTDTKTFYEFPQELEKDILNIDEALIIAAESDYLDLIYDTIYSYCRLSMQFNRISSAINHLDKTISKISRTTQNDTWTLTDRILGRKYHLETFVGDFKATETGLQNLLKKALSCGNLEDKNGIILSLALLASRSGRLEEAEKLWEEILVNAETNEDWNKKGDALLELSNIDLEQNRYEAGIIKLQKALVIFKKARFRAGVAICLNNLSNMMVYQNKNDEAMVLLQASLEIKRELGDKHLIASSLLNLAALHVDAKEYEKARLLFTEALTLREEIKDIRGISSAISELANLSLRENKPLEAMDLAERALAYSQKINDIRGITYAYMILGYCYLEQKQIEKATQYLIQALEIAKEHRIILFIVDILYGFILILQDQQQIRLALTINNYLDYHFKSELSFNPIYDPQLTNRLERIATAEEKDEVRNSVAILDLLSLVDLVIYS